MGCGGATILSSQPSGSLDGILQPELLGQLEKKVKEIKTCVKKNDAHRAVEGLKKLTAALSLTNIDRQKVFAEIVDKFQEIDENFYATDSEQGLFVCYAIKDRELFDSCNTFVAQIEHKGVVKQKRYIEPYGSSGKYGGVGFEIMPFKFTVEEMRNGILS